MKREQTKDSPSFLERVGDKIDDVTNGNDQLSREETKDSLKRQKSRDSPSFLERVEGKLDDFTGGNGQRSREATKDSLKREKTRDSPSFLERVGDKLDDVTNGKEQRSREATKDSLKREKTRDSPSFLEQVADKISDVIDGDGSSENGDRIGTESGQQQQTNTRQNSGKPMLSKVCASSIPCGQSGRFKNTTQRQTTAWYAIGKTEDRRLRRR